MPATGSAAFDASTEKVRSAANSSLTATLGSFGAAAAGAAISRRKLRNVRNIGFVPFAARTNRTLSYMADAVDRDRRSFDQWTGGGLGNFADGRRAPPQSPSRYGD